jgi:adenylate cyclase
MLPQFINSDETRPTPRGNASLHVARLAQAGRWLSERLAKRNSYVGRLKAAVYADMVGYSRLFRLDDAGTVARLRKMHRMLRPAIRRHHGRLVQTGGDSMLITFDSLTEAVRCAVTVQYALALENDGWPDDRRMQLRVGVDLGDVIVDGSDFHGDGVIMAVRLQEVCPPGGVCISAAVHDRGGDRLGLPFERMGALTLKNITQPVEAFVLRAPVEEQAGALQLVG